MVVHKKQCILALDKDDAQEPTSTPMDNVKKNDGALPKKPFCATGIVWAVWNDDNNPGGYIRTEQYIAIGAIKANVAITTLQINFILAVMTCR